MLNFKAKLLHLLQIQAVTFLVTLPILTAWGLPISWMSPIGNLIFAPFLVIFLALSLLIFSSEIIGFPNLWGIKIFELFTQFWLKLIGLGSQHFLIAFPAQAVTVFTISATALIILLFIGQRPSLSIYLWCLLVITLGYGFYQKWCLPDEAHYKIHYKKTALDLQYLNHVIIISDSKRFLGQLRNPVNWITYQLLPLLARRWGATRVKKLVLIKPTKRIVDLLPEIQRVMRAETVAIANYSDNNTARAGAAS